MNTATCAVTHNDNSLKTKENVVIFLRDLATKLENNELSDETALKITEFFMKFNFIDSMFASEENADVLKFLSLGWYVYTHLIPSSSSCPSSTPASATPPSSPRGEPKGASHGECVDIKEFLRVNQTVSCLESLD